MRYLKQSTSVDLPIGPFLDQTDGFTAETGLTITQPDVRLKKNDAAWAQKNAAQTLSHEENGWYEVTLDATDTNTLGQLMLAVHESGALPVWHEFMILPANVWDSLFGADKLQVDVTEFGGSALNAAAAQVGANVVQVKAQTVPDPAITGVPKVDVTHFLATSLASANMPSNAKQVADSTEGAERLREGTKTTTKFTVGSGSTTSSIVMTSTSPASAVNDQFNGLVIAFAFDTTTAALRGQKAIITDWVHSTLTAAIDPPLTNAPVFGDAGTFQ